MKILVFSDSHGMLSSMRAAIKAHPDIEHIIHLGDYGYDIDEIAAENPTYIIEAVHGNCDRNRKYPSEKILQYVGKRILITHGHNYGVKYTLSPIIAKGLQEKVDVILFGHTHEYFYEVMEGILVINPGSISKSRMMSKVSCVILEISKAGIQVYPGTTNRWKK